MSKLAPITLLVGLLTALPGGAQLGPQKAFPGVPQVAEDGGCGFPNGLGRLTPGSVCSAGQVVAPAGWYSGDTHEHAQLCFDPTLRTEEELRDEMIARGENVSSLLLWGVRLNPSQYLAGFGSLITGSEDPSTASYPLQAIQYGVETSGFQCGHLGHTIALNIDPAQANFFVFGGCPGNDPSGDYAAPVMDFFRQGPSAVIGYAHQTWPVPLYAPPGYGLAWEDPSLPSWFGADARCSAGKVLALPDPTTTNIHPTLAAHDVATGRVDFLEGVALHVDLSTTSAFEDRWYGLYYKLLSAGQRVAITGGTDADCVLVRQNACEPRTWVKMPDGRSFSYDAWTEGIAAGRTSVSDGGFQFLEIQAGGLDAGGNLYVNTIGAQAPLVGVRVRYHVDPTTRTNETLEIVQDGDVVATVPMGARRGGVFDTTLQLPFVKSGWVAARTASGGAHTGAVYVYVDRKPIANCAEAEYFTLYSDYLDWLFDQAAAFPDPSVLTAWVGCSEPEIRAHIAEGRRVFAAVRDYAAGPPPNVRRLGFSTPSDRGPMGIGVDVEPQAGKTLTIDCFNAPPGALGALLLSPWFSIQNAEILLGARLFVISTPMGIPYLAFPARSSQGGYAQAPVTFPAMFAGYDVYAQWAWLNPPGYDSLSVLSASDVLELGIQ